MIDEICADRVVTPGQKRDLQLRPDAVSARHEHGTAVAISIQFEKAAEGSDFRQHASGKRRTSEPANPANRLVAGVDVDAGIAVIRQKSSFRMSVCISAR